MKRWISWMLVFVLCCSFVPQSASAQTMETEELILGLVENLIAWAGSGIEVSVDQPGKGRSTFVYAPPEEGKLLASLTTPEACYGLDMEGIYIEKDGKSTGVQFDEMLSLLLRETAGITHLPCFSAEDGALAGDLLTQIWTYVAESAVRFEVAEDEEAEGSGSAELEVETDRLAVAVEAALKRMATERAADVDALLREYGELIGMIIPGFPQNVAELRNMIGLLKLASLRTGMKIALAVNWTPDTWQISGEVCGWDVEASWEDERFLAIVSPGESLSDELPVYTLDSRDLEKLIGLVYGLIDEIPDDALYFSGPTLYGRNYSFRIDTYKIYEYIRSKVPLYLQVHEEKISALAEKYLPFLKLISPQAERWGDVMWIVERLQRWGMRMPMFSASMDLTIPWYGSAWQLTAAFNDSMLSLSGDRQNITALLSVDDYSAYTLDGRLTGDGGELVLGVNQGGRLRQLTLKGEETEVGYLLEAYTEKEQFYAVLQIGRESADLTVLEDGEETVTGSIRTSGDYLYIDLISDELTLDGMLVTGDSMYTMTLLVNGRPVTGTFEYVDDLGWKLTFRSDDVELDAEWGPYGARLYVNPNRAGGFNTGWTLSAEANPNGHRYSFVVNTGRMYGGREYGFTYAPGRLSTMNGRQSMIISDATAWTDGCLNATDVMVAVGTVKSRSFRIVSRVVTNEVLEADVYADGADEAMLTITIRMISEKPGQPQIDQRMTAEEFFELIEQEIGGNQTGQ